MGKKVWPWLWPNAGELSSGWNIIKDQSSEAVDIHRVTGLMWLNLPHSGLSRILSLNFSITEAPCSSDVLILENAINI